MTSELRYSFTLYLVGETVRSRAAVANIRSLCDNHLEGRYDLDLIDVVQRPDLAEEARVLATPMVVRTSPLPQLRAVGDLSDPHRTAAALGILDPGDPPGPRDEASEGRDHGR